MAEDGELVPQEGELIPAEADSSADLEEIFTQMSGLIDKAVASLQFQNVRDADMAARAAEALYATSAAQASPHDLLLLRILKHATCLFAPFTRALAFQIEGRFSKALIEIGEGLDTAREAIATVDQYAQRPDHDEDVLHNWQPVLSTFPILLRAWDAWIRADIVGYQGNIPKYRELLQKAVVEFRGVEELPPSVNPMFLLLVNMCTTQADRLETRVEVFESESKQRYLIPTGDKIFIIHGHDEAKWRELRDMLEDRLDLKTVILKEEPGAGETLIRKFEEYADDCCYAFALLTPDDFIEKEGESYFQARPNVLFELGWFYGHFGRDRVCIVKKSGTEMPSDLDGILSIDFYKEVSEGFVQVQDELRRVGVIEAGDRD